MSQEPIGKEDAKKFFLMLCRHCMGYTNTIRPRDIINNKAFHMNYKRAWYLLDKWSGKGWYDYGVNVDLGWITDKGYEIYIKLRPLNS